MGAVPINIKGINYDKESGSLHQTLDMLLPESISEGIDVSGLNVEIRDNI